MEPETILNQIREVEKRIEKLYAESRSGQSAYAGMSYREQDAMDRALAWYDDNIKEAKEEKDRLKRQLINLIESL